jgi:photosystem II stability/assembly factor-like uncharacterized protein
MYRSFIRLTLFFYSLLVFLCVWAFAGPPVWRNSGPSSGINIGPSVLDPQSPSTFNAGTNVWTSNGPDGGSISSLVIDPGNPLILYAGTGAGVYKSINGGASWTAINHGLEYKGFSALSFDPHDSSTLYASSGKIYKSTDGGEDWHAIADISAFFIVINPVNPAVMYVADGGGIKKSLDGGSSWTLILKSKFGYTTYFYHLILDPVNPETIYAGESPNYYDSSGCLHKSTDGGRTWTDTGLYGNISCLAIDPATPSTIFAGASPYGHHGAQVFPGGMFKSLDGGATWTEIISGADFSSFSDVRIHPLFHNEIYVVSDARLLRSLNGGVDWQEIAPGLGNKKTIWSLVFDPVTPSTIYAASSYCGVLKSVDRGAHWAEINTNIRNAYIQAIAVDPSHPDTLYAGAYQGGGLFVTIDGGASWQTRGTVPTGHLRILAVDPVSPATLYAAGSEGIFKSTDSGLNWDPILNGLPSYFPEICGLVINPKDHLTIFAASYGRGIYKSTDGGGSWKAAMNGLPIPPDTSVWVNFLVPDPTTSNVLYSSLATSIQYGLYKTSDGGANWARISYLTGDVFAVDPVQPSLIYLANDNIIYRSSDGGGHWSWFYESGNIYESLIIHPLCTSVLYALGYIDGISISVDGGASWRAFNEGLGEIYSYPYWTCLAINPKSPEILYLSTEGGGVFRLDFDSAEYPPTIALNRKTLNFDGTTDNLLTGSQSVTVSNAGGGTLNWTATPSHAWITVHPGSGINTGTINIGVNPSGLQPGVHNGSITISDPNAFNNPQTIDIALNIYYVGGWTASPIGSFDTPLDGATVMSSVAVTGWALDDIEVMAVKIYRNPVGNEPTQPNGLVFIGDAIFVEGARPDVETTYPGYPLNYRAGWGYMLLTNSLPDGGNGTFTLHAIATDKEGNQVSLGQKTITCDNRAAVKPFGAIDTPTQGGSAFGSAFVNFGWALTPPPKSIPFDGSTITVWVDGLPLGHPAYNNYRADVATKFPGYANSNGAVGYYYLDTTGYENKVHTIAWSVADSDGAVDGIGSRYFQILNTGSGSSSGGREAAGSAIAGIIGGTTNLRSTGGVRSIEEIQNMISDFASPVHVRRGYGFDRPAEPIYPNPERSIIVSISELERIAIYLDPNQSWENREELEARGQRLLRRQIVLGNKEDGNPGMNGKILPRYSAYLLVGSELRPLPIGSTFDAERGVLYWQPGPGFLGDYEFIFVDGDRNTKKAIKIRIGPR